MTVVTRFAPSPTGYLHVGGARTALFNYLFARHHQGRFILRIEDTDKERSTEESVEAIFSGLGWLGLDYDGDVIFQSDNFPRYQQKIEQLLQQDKAYYCHCSKERLDALREEQMSAGSKPRYDGHCRDLGLPPSPGNAIVRFKTPLDGAVSFIDEVRGPIKVENTELDDLVIARPDGSPTYNFSVVVDDADMGITHVIRGDDHINNTPRQINIYHALGLPVPSFAHVPMILGDDGARLSKRHGAVSVMQYAEEGYLPEAVLNYLVRLGWSHGDQELFDVSQMIELFDLSGVNRAPSSFNTSKLQWINQQYMQHTDSIKLAELLTVHLKNLGVSVNDQAQLEKIIDLFKDRAHTINEVADMASFLFKPLGAYEEKSIKKAFTDVSANALRMISKALSNVTWTESNLKEIIANVVADLKVGFGKVGMPLRVVLTGCAQGPANESVMLILGREECIKRIQKGIAYIEAL